MPRSWMPETLDFNGFFEPCLSDSASQELDLSDALIRKLALMTLLYDLPYNYIAPIESYLDEDRIKFFYLDYNWIFAMLDGAMSLGRNTALDYKHDWELIEQAYNKAVRLSNMIRSELQGKDLDNVAVNSNSVYECTGFIMRSPLVRGWRGLEFKAYGGGHELKALRIENLTDNIIIGIYSGIIDKLEILEPPEGLHYGFNSAKGKLTKTLRNLDDGALITGKEVEVKQRGNRVIDFGATAANIKKELKIEDMKSSHMALEMIQNAYKLQIDYRKQES